MPEDTQERAPEQTQEQPEYENLESDGAPEEPYSAQVLRMLFEDEGALLERYDQMLGPLEHKDIHKFLTHHCEFLDSHMSEIEDLFAKHHSGLPSLGGEEGGEVDSNEEEREEEEPSGEEVAEAMGEEEQEQEPQGKNLTHQEVKELRALYKTLEDGGESEVEDKGFDESLEHAELEAGLLEPHELDHVVDAIGFLDTVQKTPEGPVDENFRKHAFHHGEHLRSIAGANAETVPGMEALNEESKAVGANMDMQTKTEDGHRPRVGKAAEFFSILEKLQGISPSEHQRAAEEQQSLIDVANAHASEEAEEPLPDDENGEAVTHEEAEQEEEKALDPAKLPPQLRETYEEDASWEPEHKRRMAVHSQVEHGANDDYEHERAAERARSDMLTRSHNRKQKDGTELADGQKSLLAEAAEQREKILTLNKNIVELAKRFG